MARQQDKHFSGTVTVFRDKRLPEEAIPAGYCALIDAYDLNVPLPRTLFATGARHRITKADRWHILTPRHKPEASLSGHLTFAVKHEGLDLAVLKRLFGRTGPRPIVELIRSSPTGGYARRIWFLYEWLLGRRLDLPDAASGSYVPVLDSDLQLAGTEESSPRHRVKNNLPGTPEFCPLVFRSERLEALTARNLARRAQEVTANIPKDVMSRAAAFLLLKDSRASYAIEGERPPRDRAERWGRAIGEAGRHPLDEEELLRLQRIVIGDARFVKLGFRSDGGFVGEHDRESHAPLPEHISACPEDIPSLVSGILEFEQGPSRGLDPVIAAAALAFGFVYVHPFTDGNGRIHRYLIHHVLAARGFTPEGFVFPVSAAILERISDYERVLSSYSKRLLPCIEWDVTSDYNVRVANETGDFYRFFDATPHAEFLYECVERTIDQHLPAEAAFLERFDTFNTRVQRIADMPDRMVHLLFSFLEQNGGRLSGRGREGEFSALTDEEAAQVEATYAELFGPEKSVHP
ncbi:MAG: Fic family protein [Spirochaetaceae bacterium]